MGNKAAAASPFPEYAAAISHLNAEEISHIKQNFKTLS
jgi:hypothetical protein